ncbi:hypothetical protein RCL1_008703 [Eukaryota sp. TZLM3-RCL]
MSRLFYNWITPVMKKGAREDRLEQSDLPPLYEEDKCHPNTVKVQSFLSNGHTITSSLIKTFGRSYSKAFLPKIIHDVFLFAPPILLQRLVLSVEDDSNGPYYPYILVLLMFLSTFLTSICINIYFQRVMRVAFSVRATLSNVIYLKSLKISSSAFSKFSKGKIQNLMSADAESLNQFLPYANTIWSAALQLVIALILLWRLIKWGVFSALIVIIIMIPINKKLTRLQNKYYKKSTVHKDQRMKVTNDMVSGIKAIKIHAYEEAFYDSVQGARDEEVAVLKSAAYHRAMTSFLMAGAPLLVAISTFLALFLSKTPLTPEIVFPTLSLLNLLRFPLTILPRTLSNFVEAKVSLDRINDFMKAEEVQPVVAVTNDSNCVVSMENASFTWEDNEHSFNLKDLSFSILKGQIVAFIASVGQGKSSVLNAILGELNLTSGTMSANLKSLQYVSQSPWLIGSTIRENIVLGSNIDEEFLSKCIDISGLFADFETLPNGIDTEIGSNGINLSGGQKARVALARAVYHRPEVFIVDDAFAALDATVSKHCFTKLVDHVKSRGATLILATNQISYLTVADQIHVLDEGKIIQSGNFSDLESSCPLFSSLLIQFSVEETSTSTTISPQNQTVTNTSKAKVTLVKEEVRKQGGVDAQVYFKYFASIGGSFALVLLLSLFTLSHALSIIGDFSLSRWSQSQSENSSHYFIFYTTFSIAATIFLYLRSLYLAQCTIAASRVLHKLLLKRVLQLTLSFFDVTPQGRIMNRFSKDIDSLDRTMIFVLTSFLATIFQLVGVFVVISIVIPWFLLFLPFLFTIYFYFLHYYRRASREMKRLEAITRSPIYSSFGDTLNGLVTIRASQSQNYFIQSCQDNIDEFSRATFAMTTANRWLGLRMDMIGASVVSVAALLAIYFELSPALLGLVLSYSLNTSGYISWLVRIAIDTEQSFNAVERILEYSELDTENLDGISMENWPERGSVEFHSVSMRYRPDLPCVLSGISFTVKPGEKVAIVGRTGAGKSSLLVSLLRLTELEPGHGVITIDNVPTNEVSLNCLRGNISVVPQDPFLFSNSIRRNVDVFGVYSDEELLNALSLVGLSSYVDSLPQGLDTDISSASMSSGQRQLLSFSRTLLSKNKIILLDEATASVDNETDTILQNLLREYFAGRTIITIAHRISTVMDYDRVLVVSEGKVVESGNPKELASDGSSLFSSFVRDASLL